MPITDAGNGVTRPRVDALAALFCPGGVFPYALDSPNPQRWAAFGASVAVGEVNGDGKTDIAVGAPFEHVGGNEDQGRAYVFSGADSSLLFTLDTLDPQDYANFGGSLAVGDVNADGRPDIVAGAIRGASVYVFPSEPGPPTPTPTPAAVGGVAELPGVSDSSDRDYIALAGLAALALVAFTGGAWYARRQ